MVQLLGCLAINTFAGIDPVFTCYDSRKASKYFTALAMVAART